MKRLRSLKPQRLVLFGVLLAILTFTLFFWMREVVHEVVVLPLSYLIYLGGIVVDTTPQVFFWFAMVSIAIYIAYRSLNKRQKPGDLALRRMPVDDQPKEISGRLSFWATKVNILRQHRGSYFLGGFHLTFGRMVMDLISHRYHLTPAQVEDRVRDGSLELPDEVKEYLLFSLSRQQMSGGRFRRLWEEFITVITRWLHWPVAAKIEESSADRAFKQIDRVIQFMEDDLEVSHEHPSQSSR